MMSSWACHCPDKKPCCCIFCVGVVIGNLHRHPKSSCDLRGSRAANSNLSWDIAYFCGRGGYGNKIFRELVSFPTHLCKLWTSKQLLAMKCLTLLYYAKITSFLFDLIPQQPHFLLSNFNSCWSQQSCGREEGLSHGIVTPHWCELLNISYIPNLE